MPAPKVCAVLLLPLLAAAGAHAQVPPISEAEALARLSPDSPRVRALGAQVDLARAGVALSRGRPNPQISVSREAAGGLNEHYTLVTQVLPITGRRGLEIQASDALLRGAEARADALLRLARAELRQAFVELATAGRREGELRRIRNRLADLAGILATREAAGDVAGFDRLRAERELFDADADLSGAAAARARAQAALAAFFPDYDDPRTLAADLPPRPAAPADLPPLDVLVARALDSRGELKALEAEAEAARFAERVARRRRVPEPQVVAGIKTVGGGPDRRGPVLALQASLPLFDPGRGEALEARGRERLAIAQADAFRTGLRAAMAGVREIVVARRDAATRYARAAANADEVERVARASYDAGERGILELLDAHRSAATARLRQLDLGLAERLAEIELEFLSGWELPR